MKVLIINSAEPDVSEFHSSIENILHDLHVQFLRIQYRECLIADFNNCDGIIISGSPQGDDIVEHHQPYFQWVKETNKPVFGICAGHHVIGYLFGAKYMYSIEPESGKTEIEIVTDDPIFKGMPKRFTVHQMHNDSITVPENFIHLAKSATCSNQVMKHTEKPIYTFQFHPEYLNPELFKTFIEIVRFC